MRTNSKPAWYIIMPTTRKKTIWNLIIIILLGYTSTVVPFQVAFVDVDSFGTVIFNYVVDFLFGIDIIINCLSAYEVASGKMEVRISKIIRTYMWKLPGWFWIDLLATFPF